MVSRIDRKQVVDTALRLLNEVGLDGLTLRRIAKELNVQAPALYWHFKNKQELLDEMATEMFRRMAGPVVAGEPGADPYGSTWQETVVSACRAMRSELLGYRDGGKVFSGTRMTDDSAAGPLDSLMVRLTDAGFPLREAARAWWTAYNYTVGLVIEEQSVHPVPGRPDARDPAYDQAERERRLGPDYPLAAQVGAVLFGDIEQSFEAGLRIIVAGIEATLGPDAAG
ncbi:TetR/AcrR family transcriptional regulator C-terminal domain-containing protein [Streptomyces caniferus]|uniref:TetR family transcriptional regulator n=1 Tax=Streptomyces caniferus TaxID=285557 RepID=A0A640S1S3_9ACTN|nr:TetR/AcrR family transcriptional regulator C-terminal domain-containing protein [Streptomyces caniferus]GFE05048.1 TetR family transcriptional regulator [Streptomyces caniferus]